MSKAVPNTPQREKGVGTRIWMQPALTTVPVAAGLSPLKPWQDKKPCMEKHEAAISSDSALPAMTAEKEQLRPKCNVPNPCPQQLSIASQILHCITLHTLRLLQNMGLRRKKSSAVHTEGGQKSERCPSILQNQTQYLTVETLRISGHLKKFGLASLCFTELGKGHICVFSGSTYTHSSLGHCDQVALQ